MHKIYDLGPLFALQKSKLVSEPESELSDVLSWRFSLSLMSLKYKKLLSYNQIQLNILMFR